MTNSITNLSHSVLIVYQICMRPVEYHTCQGQSGCLQRDLIIVLLNCCKENKQNYRSLWIVAYNFHFFWYRTMPPFFNVHACNYFSSLSRFQAARTSQVRCATSSGRCNSFNNKFLISCIHKIKGMFKWKFRDCSEIIFFRIENDSRLCIGNHRREQYQEEK